MKPVHQASVLLLTIILMTSGLSTAWGRAGGGGGYSGGSSSSYSSSSSSYSSSSGGGGSGEPADLISLLLAIPIALVGGLISLAMSGSQSGQGQRPSESLYVSHPRRAAFSRRAARAKALTAEPTFDLNGFLKRFEVAFREIQDAWQNQDMQPIRHFVSDGIYERFSLQIEEQQQFGYRDQMSDLSIDSRDLAEFTQDDAFDVLTVVVTATAVDFRVSIDTGQYISGNRDPDNFTEMWTFVRRRGTAERTGNGLIEGNCPNCGSSITLNQADQCTSCKSHIRSGEYDWILSEITQSCEWRPRSSKQLSWTSRYRAEHDAGFSSQHLEDRASVIFWREAMAARLADVRPLLKVATDVLCDELKETLDADIGTGTRQYPGDRAVGSVDLLGIVSYETDDFALVEIRWSASVHEADRQGHVEDLGQWARRRSLYVLKRHPDVTSQLSRAITSAHCANCGAAESKLTAHSCEFCGTVLNDGRQDWVLHEIHTMPHSTGALGWTNQLKTQHSQQATLNDDKEFAPWYANSDVLAWAACVMAPELTPQSKQRDQLLSIGRKAGVPDANVEALITAVQGKTTQQLIEETKTDDFAAMIPQNHIEAAQLLQQLTEIVLLDGTISDHEQETLFHIGRLMEFSPHDMRLMINKRKACLAAAGSAVPNAQASTHGGYQSALLSALFCVAAADRKITAGERKQVVRAMARIGRKLTKVELRDALTTFVDKRKQLGWEDYLYICCQEMERQCQGNGRKRIARRAMAEVARADTAVDERSKVVIATLTRAINSAA